MKNSKLRSIAFCSMVGFMTCAYADDSLYVNETGNVGVGTSVPSKKLHVEDETDASVFVNNTSEVGSERVMFILKNKGKTRFVIQNTAFNSTWTFDNAGTRFQINKAGSGLPVEFEVHDNGDGYFGGDVYAQEVLLTSARDSKTDFQVVDGEKVLDQLESLDISSWRYKEDDVSARHIGPVAEDFKEVFELGNGTHISAVDSGGIAFAAIKALIQENDSLKARLDALESQQAEIQATMAKMIEDHQEQRVLNSTVMN